MEAHPLNSPENTILTFVIDNTMTAFATLADALGEPESWDNLAYFPETLAALRKMPENFQKALGKPYIAAIFAERYPEEHPMNVPNFSDLDTVLASGLDDLLEMTIQAMQQQKTKEELTRRNIRQGTGNMLVT